MYSGGTILPIYIGSDTPVALKELLKAICENTHIPYISFIPTFSICSEHGHISGAVEKCPMCDKETEIFTKVVGFIRPVNNFNKGKLQEYKERSYGLKLAV
jgi:ribonucleoside-triphosphate reductase